jgi:hypothetical protein
LTIALPEDGTFGGTFGFLPLDVTDPDNDSGVQVNFFVNVQNDNPSAVAGHLGFSDLGSIAHDTEIEGRPLEGATDAVTLTGDPGNRDCHRQAPICHRLAAALTPRLVRTRYNLSNLTRCGRSRHHAYGT